MTIRTLGTVIALAVAAASAASAQQPAAGATGAATIPAAQVAQIVDGRRAVKGHGGGEMPVWGDAFDRSSDAMPAAEVRS